MFVSRWTVDYGDGPHPVVVPHAWGQEVSVEWEGPATYRAEVDVPRGGGTLRFWGVSYAAEVLANGEAVARHEGIWDAFDVPLPGGKVELEVRVTKNGGPTYPVETVASGSLPHLFHTFGGIYREVELLETDSPLSLPPPEAREALPYVRGVVHRGWYPDLGHPNPDEHVIRRELREIKALGFNTVKFAGWVPPHRYLNLLEAEGLMGWIELPQGGMDLSVDRAEAIFEQIERIVRQYRYHACLAIWTLGDIFWSKVPAELRTLSTETVRALTGAAWVTDAPREFFDPIGTFDQVGESFTELLDIGKLLDSFHPGPRDTLPILLSDFAAAHSHRDLARLGDELPFWASSLPELNAHGVRLGMDLALKLERSRFANEPTRNGHKALMESSRGKEAFVRKTLVEAARSRAGWIQGYALGELRDTPNSSAGLFDDWGMARLIPGETKSWNCSACLFTIPHRQLGYGGAMMLDPLNHFEGEVWLDIGLHTTTELSGALWWRILDESGRTVARGAGPERRIVGAREVGNVAWLDAVSGSYRLEAGFGATENAWDLWVVAEPDWETFEGWGAEPEGNGISSLELPGGDRTIAFHRKGASSGGVLFLERGDEGADFTWFWRESALEFRSETFWKSVPFREQWQRLLPVSANAHLSSKWINEHFGEFETVMNWVDTSPHSVSGEAPILVRTEGWLITTLRPNAFSALQWNPAGCALLQSLMRSL